jgi:hypothetical protein
MSREAHVRSCERLWVKLPGRLDLVYVFALDRGIDRCTLAPRGIHV